MLDQDLEISPTMSPLKSNNVMKAEDLAEGICRTAGLL
ncbi:MAG: hypothetical protein OJF47_000173 [Nitrospira sp.]|nr:MAG: hypothetical protein OJF47_000173 [Nitrospira sp.]